MSRLQYHKKKLVVENGKELDLLCSPPRIPSAAHTPPPIRITPVPAPASYWHGSAQAARRTRQVADELYWSAMDGCEGDAVSAASGMPNGNAVVSPQNLQQQQQTNFRPQSAITVATTIQSDGGGGRSVLDHVHQVTVLPLSRSKVAPDLRNKASDMVKLALRGRAVWEYQQQRRFGSASAMRAVSASLGGGGATTSPGAAARPTSAATRPRSAAATSALAAAATRPSTAGGCSTTATTKSLSYIFQNQRLRSDGSNTKWPRPPSATERDLKELNKFDGPVATGREILEFERRAAQLERYRAMQQQQQQR